MTMISYASDLPVQSWAGTSVCVNLLPQVGPWTHPSCRLEWGLLGASMCWPLLMFCALLRDTPPGARLLSQASRAA